MFNEYFVYILANQNNRVLYTGMTNSLERRITEHKSGTMKGFAEKYNVHRLVYVESNNDVGFAIAREKQIKSWRREKKNKLISSVNPEWRDLAERWFSGR